MIVIVIDIEMWLKWVRFVSPTLLFSHYQQVITINKLENLSSILVDRYYITFVTQYKKKQHKLSIYSYISEGFEMRL